MAEAGEPAVSPISHPVGRGGGEEQRRQREDHDQPGDDEADRAHERSSDAA
jgi:hypothetical protein